MNREVRPFEEYKEMIQNMSKDNMIKGLYDLSANIIEKDKEIERLNNLLENDSVKNLKLIELINKIRDVAEDNNITGIEARLKILEILEN